MPDAVVKDIPSTEGPPRNDSNDLGVWVASQCVGAANSRNSLARLANGQLPLSEDAKAVLMVTVKYEDADTWEGMDRKEAESILMSLTENGVIPSDASNWNGLRIADISANNCTTIGQLVLAMEAKRARDDASIVDKPVEILLFDMSYEQGSSLLEKAAQRVSDLNQQLGENFSISNPVRSDANELSINDIGGKPLDVIFDRLGAIFHTANSGSREQVFSLISHLATLLSDHGKIVSDAYLPGSFYRADGVSSYGALSVFAQIQDEEFTKFLTEKGLQFKLIPMKLEEKSTLPSGYLMVIEKI